MKNYQKQKGITLIALVITIIILLILAGITISLLKQDGLIEKAEQATEATNKAQIQEEIEFELINIVADYRVKREELTNTIIQNELANRLPEIEIKEDLTGSYKGYEYQIEEDFKVHIMGKADNSMQIKVTPKLGTTYIIINVEASSTYGDIVQYEYMIDGEIFQSNEPVYNMEKLEPESSHIIKVVAIDEKQNRKESGQMKIKTEPRTYLYKEGNECKDITNGWTIGYNDGDNPGVGRATKEENNIFLETWGTWCSYICYPNERVNFSNYSKMLIELYDIKVVATGYARIDITVGEAPTNYKIHVNPELSGTDIICEIEELNKVGDPTYCYIAAVNGVSARIKNIWLEK